MPFGAGDEVVGSQLPSGFGGTDPVLGGTPATGRQAQDIGDALIAGMQNSSLGLALRGKLPSMTLGEDAPWYQRLAAGAAGLVGDAPAMLGGAIGGTAAAGPVGGMAGAFAAPMALRDGLIAAYNHNHALSWEGAWDIAKAGLVGGAEGAVLGATTGGAGKVAGTLLAGSGKAAVAVGTAGAEISALTATSAALNGKLPTWQDFMDNALLLGGVKAAVHIAGNMRATYAETGKTPAEQLADAQKDPALKEEMMGPPKPDGLAAYAPLALEERIKAAVDADPRPEAIRAGLTATEPPKLGEPLEGDPVKYEYIADTETAKGVLRSVTNLYQDEISKQTRGVVTNKATAIEALKNVSDGAIDPHIVGEAGNAAEIYARAHLLKGATNYAVQELGKLAGLSDAEITPQMKLSALAAIERVSMLKSEIEGVGAEAGRALQILRAIKRDPAFLGDAENLLAVAERKGKLQDIAAMVARFKDPAQMAEFSRRYTEATTTEKMLEAWKAGILSGPQTHLANILGNMVKWFVEVPESALSATLFAADRAAHGDPLTMAQYKARAFAPILGLQYGAKEALTAAAEVWRGSGEHVEKADQYRGAIEGKAGEIIRLPFKALQVEDVLFRTVAERSESYKMAVDRAVKEGFNPDTVEGKSQIMQYTQRPEFGLSEKAGLEAIKQVQDAGAEGVFSQRLGPRLEQIQRAMAGHWSQFIIPFFRTPANLVSWAVQHTPGLNFMSGRWMDDWTAGGERKARAVARVAIGTGLAVTAYSMAQDGTLTGGGLFDKEQSGTKRAAGWQPYSIKIGDTYYSYQRMEPVAKVLGVAADLVELHNKSTDEEDKGKLAAMLVLMFGNATVSTTYLSGLSGAMNAVLDPERYGGNFVNQYATSLVPKILGQTASAMDPHKREVDGVLDAIQSQLPFLREKLLPKRDVWGEPAANSKWFDVMPVSTSQVSEDKVKTEAVRLQVAIGDAPKYAEEKGPFNPKDKRVKLEPEQRDVFRAVAGQSAMKLLAPIVNAPDWENIPDFAKAEIYKKVLEVTRKGAQYAALPPEDAARVQLRQKILDKITSQTDAAAAPAAEKRRSFGK
jgi:hypothetical protein